MLSLVDRIDLGVVGDALERNVRHGFVDEPALQSFVWVAQRVVIEAGGHQALFGQRNGNARGVAGDPAAAPFFSDVGCSAATARWIKNQVAGVGGHEHATLNDFGLSFYDIALLIGETSSSGIRPNVRYWLLI